jgi:hypothetical protein
MAQRMEFGSSVVSIQLFELRCWGKLAVTDFENQTALKLVTVYIKK